MFDWFLSHYQSILTSILGGSITAITFFIIFRPRVIVCDKICKTEDRHGKECYVFKFYNISLFPCVDCQPSLFWGASTEKSDVNVNTQYEQLELSRVKSFYVPGWKYTGNGTKTAPHCITIKCYGHDFEDLLKAYGSVLEFRITLKHGFSNISRTVTKVYNRKQCIVEGDFCFGNTKKIDKKV